MNTFYTALVLCYAIRVLLDTVENSNRSTAVFLMR